MLRKSFIFFKTVEFGLMPLGMIIGNSFTCVTPYAKISIKHGLLSSINLIYREIFSNIHFWLGV